MRSTTNLLAAAVAGAFLSACGAGAGVQDRPAATSPDGEAQIRVTNNNWSDVRVYAERNGLRVRLGHVTTNATEMFRLPATLAHASGAIRLIADPIGSGDRHVTHAMTVWPGQLIDYTVSNELAISAASIRSR